MTEQERIAAVAEVLCVERCAQAGDPPCSRVCDDRHCDECLGMSKAVIEHLIHASMDKDFELRAILERQDNG